MHGHAVTNEALIKRSGTPSVAPNGKVTNNPPQHSSKFESADRLKDAQNNTKPENPNWNPPSSGTTYASHYPLTGTASTPFGYGITAGGGAQQSMQRVKVVNPNTGEVRRIVEAPGNYGYGFKANGTDGPQQMLKVTAVYKQTPDGSFKLETMYPNE